MTGARRLFVTVAVLLGVFGTIGAPAQGAPITWVSLETGAVAGATGATFTQDHDITGLLHGVSSAGPLSSSVASSDGGAADATATVGGGILGAYAAGSNSGTAGATAHFADTLTILSDTLAPGTIVDIAFGITPTFALSAPGCFDGLARVTASLSVQGQGPDLLYEENSCSGITANAVSSVFQAAVGQELVFDVKLEVFAGAVFGGGSSTADALHTLRLFADPVGTDFSYVSASGNSYLSPAASVPEPALLSFLVTGLAVCCGRECRRRRAVKRGAAPSRFN